ncbi:hypothetical protein M404DRAFT_8760 [Pisolithus tinctorius Marx 270]|uniref:Uncharacterized protein n=1 Tax=Pisolithus tinctorius Marx 270 TaxID=870435 RepID=A0A0C3NZU6_PISTI|nr:hypothetical protein M404DRAFT_8760 [Pisolithus tinctorius Marx 270]
MAVYYWIAESTASTWPKECRRPWDSDREGMNTRTEPKDINPEPNDRVARVPRRLFTPVRSAGRLDRKIRSKKREEHGEGWRTALRRRGTGEERHLCITTPTITGSRVFGRKEGALHLMARKGGTSVGGCGDGTDEMSHLVSGQSTQRLAAQQIAFDESSKRKTCCVSRDIREEEEEAESTFFVK